MATTPLPDVVAIRALMKLADGQAVVNTFHVHKPGEGIPDVATMTALLADIDTWFLSTYEATLTTADTFVGWTCSQIVFPANAGPYDEITLPKNVAGAISAGRNCPESLCAVISFKSIIAKRYARGHIFAPPLQDKADLSTPRVFGTGTPYMTRINALAAKYAAGAWPTPTWTGSQLSGWNMAIYSKQQDKIAGPAVSDVASALATTQVHWLRSRERGTS